MRGYRRRIDRLDRRVARLLRRRYRLVREIGLTKLRRGMQVEDPGREQRVLSRVAGAGRGGAAEYVRGVYRCIIDASRRVQERLGPGDGPPADRRRGTRG
jgi:chorismate mutase